MSNTVKYESRTTGKIMLNANEAYENLSDELLETIKEIIGNTAFQLYPDNTQAKLREAYAKVIGVEADQVIAGNGSDQLLGYLIGKFAGNEGLVLTFDPDFSMYDYYASSYGASMVRYPCDDDGSLDIDSFIRYGLDQNVNLVIFSNPNNPSGHFLHVDEIETIVSAFKDTPVIVDEAYIEFAQSESAVSLLGKYTNLYVTRTLSKAYGIAGMRVGFALSTSENMKPLMEGYVPYALSSVAMEVASAVLSDDGHVKTRVEDTVRQRQRVFDVLKEMKKITVYPSSANFIYGRTECRDAMVKALDEAGIVIRLYKDGETFRITIGSEEENTLLLQAMEAFEGE